MSAAPDISAGPITFGFETIRQFNRGGRSAMLAQWHRLEVPEDGGGRPLRVRWAHLRSLEEAGQLKIMVARDGSGDIVGYLFWVIELDPIYAVMIATGSPLYVCAYRRGEWLSVKMVRASEPALKDLGVKIVRIWGNREHPIAALPLRCGYKPDAESWAREL